MSKETTIGWGLGGLSSGLLEFGNIWEVSEIYEYEFELFEFNSMGKYWYIKNDNLNNIAKPRFTSGQSGYWVKK